MITVGQASSLSQSKSDRKPVTAVCFGIRETGWKPVLQLDETLYAL